VTRVCRAAGCASSARHALQPCAPQLAVRGCQPRAPPPLQPCAPQLAVRGVPHKSHESPTPTRAQHTWPLRQAWWLKPSPGPPSPLPSSAPPLTAWAPGGGAWRWPPPPLLRQQPVEGKQRGERGEAGAWVAGESREHKEAGLQPRARGMGSGTDSWGQGQGQGQGHGQ